MFSRDGTAPSSLQQLLESQRRSLLHISHKSKIGKGRYVVTRPDFIREAFAIFRSDFCEAGRKMLMLSSDPDLFLRDDFLTVMSFVELQTVPFHTTKVFADSPVYVVENSK